MEAEPDHQTTSIFFFLVSAGWWAGVSACPPFCDGCGFARASSVERQTRMPARRAFDLTLLVARVVLQ